MVIAHLLPVACIAGSQKTLHLHAYKQAALLTAFPLVQILLRKLRQQGMLNLWR